MFRNPPGVRIIVEVLAFIERHLMRLPAVGTGMILVVLGDEPSGRRMRGETSAGA